MVDFFKGLGHRDNAKTPELLGLFLDKKVVKISCGLYSSACVTNKGEVYTWGNLSNQPSQSPISPPSVPGTPIRGIAEEVQIIDFPAWGAVGKNLNVTKFKKL